MQNGRKKAVILERAGNFVVKMYLVDEVDDDEQSVGGCFSHTYMGAKSRAEAWVIRGVLP